MNKSQQKRLNDIASAIELAKSDLETLKDEIEEAYDGKSEKWQESEKGQEASQEKDNIENALSELETARDSVQSLVVLE